MTLLGGIAVETQYGKQIEFVTSPLADEIPDRKLGSRVRSRILPVTKRLLLGLPGEAIKHAAFQDPTTNGSV